MLTGKQSREGALTASHEHYLRAIWEVRTQRGYARLADVARELGVAPPTLSVGLKSLEAQGLVGHDDRRFLILTAAGERAAREVHHRFAVARAFLRDVLQLTVDDAEAVACRLEHGLDSNTTERLLDLVKLLREDVDLGGVVRRRLAAFHRSCRPSVAECSTCDLACLPVVSGPRS